MRSKPADLSAGLVAIKGEAAPSPDMPGRAGGALAAVPPAAAPAAMHPGRPGYGQRGRRRAGGARACQRRPIFTPLNFRIPASFRREFRTYAATHDLKLNELLRLCFEAYRSAPN